MAFGYELDGGFAEHVLVPRQAVNRGNLIRLPDHLSADVAVLAEPLAAVLNGQDKAGVGIGHSVVIIGAGPIGLLHVQAARASGAAMIIVSEPKEYRRAMAEAVGADATHDPASEPLTDAVRRLTDSAMADVVILAVGVPELVRTAIAIAKRGGAVNLFAGFDRNATASIDPDAIHYDEIRVSGATSSTRRQMQLAVDLLGSGRVKGDLLLSHQFPLSEVLSALRVAADGEAIKVLLIP
jgi:L-iditol 2-dehydrogenase